MNDQRPSSPAAPMREDDIGLLAPDDDDEPSLPTIRILGMKASSIALFIVVVGGAFFALATFIDYSQHEVARANQEVQDAFKK
jgi:hypothetical protein